MHRLRYHSSPPASPPTSASFSPPPPPRSGGRAAGATAAGSRARSDGGPRRGVAALLGVAIVALLAGGAVAATRSGQEGPSTADLTALAKRSVLIQGDFPTGWTADPPSSGDESETEDRALAECLGAPYDDSPDAAQVGFSSEQGLNVTSEFSVAPSLEWAKAEFATLSGSAAPGCFRKVITGMIDRDMPAGASYDIDVTRLDTAPLVPAAVLRDSTGFRATITLHRGDLTVPMTFDAVMIRHDRIEATVAFTSVGATPFPDDLRRSLTTAVATRLTG